MVQSGKPLARSFFRRAPTECARDLIGTRFEWRGCAGTIVETEAYAAEEDPACHTAFRPSARRFVADFEAGTAYVYLNYGVHWLFNILVKGPDGCGFVLFRALEPLAGLSAMRPRRKREDASDLCSGPGKLTQALGIDGDLHGRDFFALKHARFMPSPENREIQACPRIGITKARKRLWRYVDKESSSLSAPPQMP